jgi:hypothetical protein
MLLLFLDQDGAHHEYAQEKPEYESEDHVL